MFIIFDPAKDDANITKHGISLAMAERIDWTTLLAKNDLLRPYGETRMIEYGIIEHRLYCVVFTDSGDERRMNWEAKAGRQG